MALEVKYGKNVLISSMVAIGFGRKTRIWCLGATRELVQQRGMFSSLLKLNEFHKKLSNCVLT